MALFFRNARLLRNQRLCLQVQQVFSYSDVAVIAAKQPFQVELIEGKKYSWCKCGLSKKQVAYVTSQDDHQTKILVKHLGRTLSVDWDGLVSGPFCDGSHKVTTIKPVRFEAEETSSEIFLCGCKQTGSAPFCDGTHATEKVQSANL